MQRRTKAGAASTGTHQACAGLGMLGARTLDASVCAHVNDVRDGDVMVEPGTSQKPIRNAG